MNTPIEMKIEVTKRCPLKCVHCSSSAGPDCADEIPWGEAERFVRGFAGAGGKTVVITGGEPLLWGKLSRAVTSFKEMGLRIVLYTTGIGHPEHAPFPAEDLLAKLHPTVDEFIFCLHGGSATVHDSVTGVEGSYAATLAALKCVLRFGSKVTVHHVPMLLTVGELTTICRILSNMGIGSLNLLRFVPQGRGLRNRSGIEIDLNTLGALKQEIDLASRMFPDVRIGLGTPFSPLADSCDKPCSCGVSTLSLSALLRCSPCDGLRYLAEGFFQEPISSRTFRDFWSSSFMLKSVRGVRREFLCSGKRGCLAQAFLDSGLFDGSIRDPLSEERDSIPLLAGARDDY